MRALFQRATFRGDNRKVVPLFTLKAKLKILTISSFDNIMELRNIDTR